MSDPSPAREVSRITCAVHHRVAATVGIDAHATLQERARRRNVRPTLPA